MIVLAFSNISNNLSVSLIDKDKLLLDFFIGMQNQLIMISLIFEGIKKVIDKEKIDRVFVTNGPGYYTTTRITCLIAQITAFTLKKELFFIDNFKALKNICFYIFGNQNTLPVIKIASHRYRTEGSIETTNLQEIINLAQKEKKDIIFTDFSEKEKEMLRESGVSFYDFSHIYRSSLAYIYSKNDLKKSENYEIEVVY